MSIFNNNYLSNYRELNKSRVGLEFEFYSDYSYIKTMELLNNWFEGIDIYGFNEYHSEFDVSDKVFKIEPDFSGGSDMIELITGPLSWVDARVVIIKMSEWIKKYGYTDSHCSVHINISFEDIHVIDMNIIKLIMNLDEDYIYEKFPDRRNNIYARSIKWIVPFDDYIDSDMAYNHIIRGLKVPDDTKYYGVNLQKQVKDYLEFRYIGGEGYENKVDSILLLMDYFILMVRKCILEDLNEEDNIKLKSYLDDNINWMNKYKSYDEFLANIEGIKIEIDAKNNYIETCNNWDKFKDRLFNLIKSCTKIHGGIINYNTIDNTLEVVESNISGITYLKDITFIDSVLSDVLLYNCEIIDSKLSNGHIYNSVFMNVEVLNTKINNSKCLEYSVLTNCLFDGSMLDCVMKGGVFRSGSIGENADIGSDVKMYNKESFWKIDVKDKNKIMKK